MNMTLRARRCLDSVLSYERRGVVVIDYLYPYCTYLLWQVTSVTALQRNAEFRTGWLLAPIHDCLIYVVSL